MSQHATYCIVCNDGPFPERDYAGTIPVLCDTHLVLFKHLTWRLLKGLAQEQVRRRQYATR